jgi:hypothetical protein
MYQPEESTVKTSMSPVVFWLLVLALTGFAQVACAYEYPLLFTPNPGFRDLVVAGYGFDGDEVVGNCSYRTASGGSGKGGGHPSNARTYAQTCRWDRYGNLLSVTPGAPVVPSPLYVQGSMTVYAANANGGFTGADSKIPGRGFVSTPGPHYTWLTPSDSAVIERGVQTFVVMLKSDDDGPLDITAVNASSLKGRAAVKSTTCLGQVKMNATCSITVTYDPTKLTSPTGLAYDTLIIHMRSNAAVADDFIRKYTIVLPKKLEDD